MIALPPAKMISLFFFSFCRSSLSSSSSLSHRTKQCVEYPDLSATFIITPSNLCALPYILYSKQCALGSLRIMNRPAKMKNCLINKPVNHFNLIIVLIIFLSILQIKNLQMLSSFISGIIFQNGGKGFLAGYS